MKGMGITYLTCHAVLYGCNVTIYRMPVLTQTANLPATVRVATEVFLDTV